MTQRTDPRITSAPLPSGMNVGWPDGVIVQQEIRRAGTELLWALHRQRTAWAKMEQVKKELTGRNIDFIDNERAWKLATGDVTWWRGEVSSRSNALTALLSLAAYYESLK